MDPSFHCVHQAYKIGNLTRKIEKVCSSVYTGHVYYYEFVEIQNSLETFVFGKSPGLRQALMCSVHCLYVGVFR